VQHNLGRRWGPLIAAMITGPLFGLLHLSLRLADGFNAKMLTGLLFSPICRRRAPHGRTCGRQESVVLT
jgi:membrane protease YdiL (CAAX protease family)